MTSCSYVFVLMCAFQILWTKEYFDKKTIIVDFSYLKKNHLRLRTLFFFKKNIGIDQNIKD
jgi:hypothetical protein